MEPLTILLDNPRGDVVRVTWLPKEVTGYDFQRQERGIREWAWDTLRDPPVAWDRFVMPGDYVLRPSLRMFSSDRTVMVEGREVGSIDELEPGCYFIEHLPTQFGY